MERNQKAYDKLIRAVRPVLVRRFRKASRWIDMNRLDKPWFRRLDRLSRGADSVLFQKAGDHRK